MHFDIPFARKACDYLLPSEYLKAALAGATESFITVVQIWEKHFNRVFVHQLERTNPLSVEITTRRIERQEITDRLNDLGYLE